jgi:hypothetical protein
MRCGAKSVSYLAERTLFKFNPTFKIHVGAAFSRAKKALKGRFRG